MAGLGDMMMMGVLRAEDFQRAKRFYTEVLGLTEAQKSEGLTRQGMFIAGAGTAVMIYERPGIPAPENTALGFVVPPEDFEAVLAELRAKGVTLEDYDIPEMGLKTVDGVAEFDGNKAAWFKDSESNIINIGTM